MGWDPYPLSIRSVNWIKWHFGGNSLGQELLGSLAVQARSLERQIEWHLLGNHLWANAKALIFCGVFFETQEADRWKQKGFQILEEQLAEQILQDGGHFERSPMYHSIILEDLLDLINLSRAYPDIFTPLQAIVCEWEKTANNMMRWLSAMTHPDGEISSFNDAVIGEACAPNVIFDYAARLGLASVERRSKHLHLSSSGYFSVCNDHAWLLADVAEIGPDYQPGHAHADTLSFELSIGGRRVITNTGITEYQRGECRNHERSTSTHNTIELNGQSSSEMWASFRVGRRARITTARSIETDRHFCVIGEHDGFEWMTGKPRHQRIWRLSNKALCIHDKILGEFQTAKLWFHFHPDISVTQIGSSFQVTVTEDPNAIIKLRSKMKSGSCNGRVENTYWAAGFGNPVPRKSIVFELEQSKRPAWAEVTTLICW